MTVKAETTSSWLPRTATCAETPILISADTASGIVARVTPLRIVTGAEKSGAESEAAVDTGLIGNLLFAKGLGIEPRLLKRLMEP
jgi:hypothetical protein